jgi:hypothetical protein
MEEMSIAVLLWGFLIKTFSFSRFILFHFGRFLCKNYDDDDYATYIMLLTVVIQSEITHMVERATFALRHRVGAV